MLVSEHDARIASGRTESLDAVQVDGRRRRVVSYPVVRLRGQVLRHVRCEPPRLKRQVALAVRRGHRSLIEGRACSATL
jgi:hypothetical protein